MSPALSRIPGHLKKYVVEQNYARYTPEDQAAWRYIMRQLKNFLSLHAHPCYVDGLKKTGIEVESIPRIDVMDDRLSEFGWGAVPVSGFIPPAAFMEFQSLGILPIASDMRSVNHLAYTPAPDIVHEAAGHAPILIHPEFAAYLKKYADVARHAIITKKDMAQYQAIRQLSDIKENPASSAAQIRAAETELDRVNQELTTVSEAGWLSRMNWWTAEYGLIGSIERPLIYGAGLLSSVGESRTCLSNEVKKIPLSLDCINVGYDITEPQPQLFVARDFSALGVVLDELSERMAFRLGGVTGLERAGAAQTVNTIELETGLQISGELLEFRAQDRQPTFLRFHGPVALSSGGLPISGHDPKHHPQGFSTPLGRLKELDKPLSKFASGELDTLKLNPGASSQITFTSGIQLKGSVVKHLRLNDQLAMISFQNCTVNLGNEILFHPDWGAFDMAVGETVVSVFGGPADRGAFGETDDFVASLVPPRTVSPSQKALFQFYAQLRLLRQHPPANPAQLWRNLAETWIGNLNESWLLGIELLELNALFHLNDPMAQPIAHQLQRQVDLGHDANHSISDGLSLVGIRL